MPTDWLTPERIGSIAFVVILLLAALAAGARGLWYYGKSYTDMKDEKDKQIGEANERAERWEGIALKALNLGERAVEKADKNG